MAVKAILLVDGQYSLRDSGSGEFKDDCLIVATSARGMAACELAKVPYRRLDSWCSAKEIAELGWKNYSALDEFCSAADRKLLAKNVELARRNLGLMRLSFYFAKIAMDSISTKVLMLSKMIVSETPRRIIAGGPATGSLLTNIPAFNNDTKLIADILASLSFAAEFEIEWLPTAPETAKLGGRQPLLRAAFCLLRLSMNAFRIRMAAGNRKFLLFSVGHDIIYILPQLAEAGFEPINPTKPGAIAHESVLGWRRLADEDGLDSTFCAAGLSYSGLMEKYCLDPISNRAAEAIAAHDAVAHQIIFERPAFGLTGAINCDLNQRCAMTALQNAGIPLVTYQEGAGYGSIVSPIYDYTEAREGDLFLAYGEGNARYYAERDWKTKPFRAVGSANLDNLRKQQVERTPSGSRPFTVMYVGTSVQSNIMHCPNNGLVDTYYFGSQIRIFESLRSLPANMKAVAKLHPNDDAARELLMAPSFRTISIDDRPYEEVVGKADLVIIDFPSTTLLMTCHTKAHIWVLIEPGVSELTETQDELLRRRARIFNSVESMVESLARYAAGHSGELDLGGAIVADQSYIRAYGMPAFDGGSAGRAVAVLTKLACSRPIEKNVVVQ